MILSKKAEQVAASITLAIDSKAKKMKEEGIDVIGFGAGEPDFNTPENIQEAAVKAIKNGYTKYTATSGIKALKDAIVEKFRNDNNLSYKASQVIVSTGAKQSLANAFQSILNPGDEVIIASPYWVSYPELVKLADGVPIFIETKEEENFKYNMDMLKKSVTSRSKAIVINSPSNPTGTVYTKDELIALANFAKENDLIIIADEIYEKLIYTNSIKHISIATLSEDAYYRTITINGVSKSYAMTGWRIGYAACGNEDIVKLMTNLQSHTTSNPNSVAQYASVEALNGTQETINHMINEFKNRRDYMVDKINSMKYISCIKPEGAFYVMVNISKVLDKLVDGKRIGSSLNFSDILLEKEKVAVVPGSAFGVDSYIRLSYATSLKNIIEGLNRIENFLNNL